VESGVPVSDDIVIGLVRNRVREEECRGGFVIDGFPCAVEQAVALRNAGIRIDYVIELDVSERDVIERLSGRRVHPASGRVYHVKFNPPCVPDTDDVTGEKLVKRPDDREDVIKVRIGAYNSRTQPIVSYYVDWQRSGDSQAPRLVEVNGQGPTIVVRDRMTSAVSHVAV
jgi:adenylate kinase